MSGSGVLSTGYGSFDVSNFDSLTVSDAPPLCIYEGRACQIAGALAPAAVAGVTWATTAGFNKQAGLTLSNGNLNVSQDLGGGGNFAFIRSSAPAGVTSGSFSTTLSSATPGQLGIGVNDGSQDFTNVDPVMPGRDDNKGVTLQTFLGNFYISMNVGNVQGPIAPTSLGNSVIRCDFDTVAKTVKFFEDGVQIGTTVTLTTTTYANWYAHYGAQNNGAFNDIINTDFSAFGGSVSNSYSLSCAAGSFSLTGPAAGLLFGRILSVSGGSFVLTGNAVTPAITMPAARGQFVLTGNATGLSAQRKITAAFGSFALTGRTANLLKGSRLTATAGAFTLSGIAAALSKSSASSMGASVATFTLTGRTTGLLVSRRIAANFATFALTGRAAGLSTQRKLAMAFGAYSLSGSATGLFRGRKIAAGAGSFVLSGSDALFRRTLTVSLGGGLFAVVGFPATLKRTAAGPSRFTVSRPTAAASVRPRQQEQRRVANLSRGRR